MKYLKYLLQFLIGGAIGLTASWLFMSGKVIDFSFTRYAETASIILFAAIILSLAFSFSCYFKVKALDTKSFTGEDEDFADEAKYRKATDHSLFSHIAIILSFLSISLCLIEDLPLWHIIGAVLALGLSLFSGQNIFKLGKIVYRDREMPSPQDPHYSDKLLDASDDGEKHVILHGLYKSNNLVVAILQLAIVAAILYSMATGQSQLFSIVLMCAVLIVGQTKYLLAIRNK